MRNGPGLNDVKAGFVAGLSSNPRSVARGQWGEEQPGEAGRRNRSPAEPCRWSQAAIDFTGWFGKILRGWTMRPFSVQAQLTTVLFMTLTAIGQEPPTTPDLTPLIEAHNRVRAEAKLPPLKVSSQLTEAAPLTPRDMAEHEKLSHEGSDGSTVSKRVKQRGYRYQEVGENVATGETMEQAMRLWLDSPPHRENILGNFTEIGVAMAPAADGSHYWCTVFGRPWPKVDTKKAPSAMIEALNRARSDAKRSTVKEDPKLTKVADYFARDLAARKVLKSKDRDGHTPFDILKRRITKPDNLA